MRNILAIFAFFLLLVSFMPERKPVIFMIGDSTMANKDLSGGNVERGWGHVLPSLLSEDVTVENHAMNGRSSKSFIAEGRWKAVRDRIRPGDYVIIQFGHNDEKTDSARHTDPGSTFDSNLELFCRETMEKGGIPVLLNSIVRRNFQDNANAVAEDDLRPESHDNSKKDGNRLIDTHGDYIVSPANVARKLGVAYVDANAVTHELVENLGPERSKELFCWIEPGKLAACPKGRQDNTHLNVHGAHVVASLLIDAIARAVPGIGQYVRHYDYTVAKDGSGDFFTVQDAVNSVPDFCKERRVTIRIRKGIYHERVIIPASKINLSIIGEEGSIIENDGYAKKLNSLGVEMSTSGSATMYIYSPGLYMQGLTIANTAGRVGQAVACLVDADRVVFRSCRFLGNQDTLYNFGKGSRQYFADCYVEGTVDFIFGSSTAVFDHCRIHSLSDGYVTAPSTPEKCRYGYVFSSCELTASDGVSKVYLSRPWRPYAKAAFISCDLGGHITPEGWNNWSDRSKEKTATYCEYGNRGKGSDTSKRASWSHQLRNASMYDIRTVLSGDDGWNPVDEYLEYR